ncbi:MAG: hypothetical protein A3J55_03175 [Candidatus Ryanbacteria bacterium RIFCSPHIGHO2_02_FULL_45_17b]|uniref:Phosphoglycerate mutase n=1 Tax=Candidatus Ryanbacteria bacterium RIFCSPHIGHO2_01_FULL_45_22 TaxID=1802114 RepID=A0A1G2FXP2_9BACT|nr:MAG: hypothetical protein A2719_00150 [Candidatus Ryanbacteria bacterium RIFCSPHIGHO2_01_FULL_45_22]OGZ46548.1 MAG: hypothetical protein A3J55_03175 [Candidatus Ryanbacteria bacterium RIFCSPHIGHO2_02_FULL_45_17b]
MTFYLLRHGAYNEGEEVLNQRGLNQTKAALDYLNEKVTRPTIISSKGPRSQQTASFLAEEFRGTAKIVNWLDKPKENQNLDIDLILNRIKNTSTSTPILVTNGEFIYQFVKQLSEDRETENPLSPLVKGEVMLCEVCDESIQVEYF